MLFASFVSDLSRIPIIPFLDGPLLFAVASMYPITGIDEVTPTISPGIHSTYVAR